MKSDLHVVAIYSGETGEFKSLTLIMPQRQELTENWHEGQTLKLSGKEYVLGERTMHKKDLIIYYELHAKGRI